MRRIYTAFAFFCFAILTGSCAGSPGQGSLSEADRFWLDFGEFRYGLYGDMEDISAEESVSGMQAKTMRVAPKFNAFLAEHATGLRAWQTRELLRYAARHWESKDWTEDAEGLARFGDVLNAFPEELKDFRPALSWDPIAYTEFAVQQYMLSANDSAVGFRVRVIKNSVAAPLIVSERKSDTEWLIYRAEANQAWLFSFDQNTQKLDILQLWKR